MRAAPAAAAILPLQRPETVRHQRQQTQPSALVRPERSRAAHRYEPSVNFFDSSEKLFEPYVYFENVSNFIDEFFWIEFR